MTASELKKYLRERGVSHTDILDKETLCRRAWEAHCDSMSVPELDAFLSDNNISIADCRDIASRRRKAMEAFRTTRPTAPKHIQKDDMVVLMGLKRDELNGKGAKVVEADCGGGRAEVCLEESGKPIKVKLENLTVVRTNKADAYVD